MEPVVGGQGPRDGQPLEFVAISGDDDNSCNKSIGDVRAGRLPPEEELGVNGAGPLEPCIPARSRRPSNQSRRDAGVLGRPVAHFAISTGMNFSSSSGVLVRRLIARLASLLLHVRGRLRYDMSTVVELVDNRAAGPWPARAPPPRTSRWPRSLGSPAFGERRKIRHGCDPGFGDVTPIGPAPARLGSSGMATARSTIIIWICPATTSVKRRKAAPVGDVLSAATDHFKKHFHEQVMGRRASGAAKAELAGTASGSARSAREAWRR